MAESINDLSILQPEIQSTTNGGANPHLTNIIQALDVIHSRTSTNEFRKQASEYLERQKHEKSAVQNGHFLASDKNHSPLVRHFGLSLLQHVLKYKSTELSPGQIGHLRGLVLHLAQGVQDQDPLYIRNKVSLLWVELAKRTWGLDWIGMDESLVELWNGTLAHRQFVLSILETLSEDIIHQEDTTSSLRGTDLNRALVEICTPYAVFKENYPQRDHHVELRCSSEGWLFRMSMFLNDCIPSLNTSSEIRACALKALACLRSLVAWTMPLAIISSQCVPAICRALTTEDDQVLLAAVEALHALYGRTSYDIEEFQGLVNLIYQNDHINLLRKLYEWSIINDDRISESKYAISKKLSELVSYVAGFLEEKSVDFTKKVDLSIFFSFLISILQHPSLVVSIPVLHSWSRLLVSDHVGHLEVINNLIAQLLETCTQRLVRYEALPEDSDDPTIVFLNEDIDTIPERHAFVGNYRRYCSQVIEVIVQKHAHEAIPHILSSVDIALDGLYNGEPSFNPSTFQKHTTPGLRADTQFTVVEAMLRGYGKWVESHGSMPQQDAILRNSLNQEQQRLALENALEKWALSLMERNFEDPFIKQRVIRLSVDFSAKALVNNPSFALKALENILMIQAIDRPEFPNYSDAVKELYSLATYEVRRLATRYAEYFSTFYEPLEQNIREILQRDDVGERPQMELSSVLLIITQRARDVDPYVRQSRLRSFIDPLRQSWASQELKQMLSSFQGFCQVLGLDKVGPYLQGRQAQKFDDWSVVSLDSEGKRLQEQLNIKFQQLPLRTTRTLLAVSTEKLKKVDPAYQIACELWKETIPLILPNLLELISHAHAFHNPDNWGGLPQEMRPIVGRILSDRFWQAGISSGSRQEFYAKIASSKATIEGFSSSVRGKVRAVREACYSVLYSMSKLEQHFYGFEELPVPLSEALYRDSISLSSHQFSVLLNISRCLIDDCPIYFRGQFLPPMMSTLFVQLDKKVTSEWDVMQRRRSGMVDDDLTEEMKDESILRQLTYSAVIMVASLLDPNRQDTETVAEGSGQETLCRQKGSMRNFVLSSPQILEPVLLFCTHALNMHDTRCCSIITRVIRSILTEFVPVPDTHTAATIREFIGTDMLKACITSVHEPYFVDMQKDLAQLISTIWILYGPTTTAPRSIMLSLPGMTEAKVAAAEEALLRSSSSRQQKALVLEFLEGVRGVRISEQGRIAGTTSSRRKERSAMQEQYMTMELEQQSGKFGVNSGPDLTGVADMFS